MPNQHRNEKFMHVINNTSIILLAALMSAPVNTTLAQPYEIIKTAINNGGSKMISANNRYVMNSSIAQMDASNMQSDTANRFTLNAGFWHQQDAEIHPEIIFRNSFE